MRIILFLATICLYACTPVDTEVRGQAKSEATNPQATATSGCQMEFADFYLEQAEIFADEEESPLTEKDQARFQRINYYPYNADFCLVAKWTLTPDEAPFEMATSTDRLPTYVKYGELEFEVGGKSYTLAAYQDVPVMVDYPNYLFVPFNDLTNGETTYEVGRYMDLDIPEGDEVLLNFNCSYQPLCSYSDRYSCPVPPAENSLELAIEAGVMQGINGESGPMH